MSKRPLRATGPDGSGLPGVGVVEREEGAGDVPSDDLEPVPVASLISTSAKNVEVSRKSGPREERLALSKLPARHGVL